MSITPRSTDLSPGLPEVLPASSATVSGQSPSRNAALDILRGLAILIVVIHHVDHRMIPGLPEFSGGFGFLFWRFRSFGASGVDLFFVISGFLVGGLLIQETAKYGTLNISRFLLRRAFKIWPSYYLVLAVLAVTGVTGCISHASAGEFLKSLAVHGLFLQNYLDRAHLTPTWTLAIEEHFYLAAPVLVLWLHRAGRLPRLGGVALGSLILCLGLRLLHLRLTHRDDDYVLTHNRFDSLLSGLFLAWLWKEHSGRIRGFAKKFRFPLILLALTLISPAFFLTRTSGFLATGGFTLLTLGYGLVLILCVALGFGKFEDSAPGRGLRQIGRWSYNIYLWHYFLPLLFAPVYNPAQLWISHLRLHPVIILMLQCILYAGPAILAGWFLTRFLEEPFLRLRDRLIPSRTAPAPGRVGATL